MSAASPQVVQQVVSIVRSMAPSFSIDGRDVQWQKGSKDCGRFAIAVATALCHGQDPSTKHWEQDKMHSHLIACLEKGQMDLFPATDRDDSKSILWEQEIKIFWQCILCHEWYHQSCKNISCDVFKETQVHLLSMPVVRFIIVPVPIFILPVCQ